jgi:signal transduction histidine kinase
MVACAVAVGAVVFLYTNAYGPAWVDRVIDHIEAASGDLVRDLGDPAALGTTVDELSQELGADVAIHGRRGFLIAGKGPPRLPRIVRHRRRKLYRGRPVVLRPNRLAPPLIFLGLSAPPANELVAIVAIDAVPGRSGRRLFLLFSAVLLLGGLGAGSYVVARSLTRRIARLEASADRIAGGDIDHRVDIGRATAADELDQLGLAFNEMAEKIQALLQRQRTLLANVSHELRTPVARMKVLIEILEERLEQLPGHVGSGTGSDVERLRRGLVEMGSDIVEIETLLEDLLTSGRLGLRADAGEAIVRQDVDLADFAANVAARFGARVQRPEHSLVVPVDALLVERLLSNLLGNARRACPHGDVLVTCGPAGRADFVRIAVEDEGPGIPPGDRETIFEPFSRLDPARARDGGGVGLGLYLCRQIARAHGGTIHAEDRPDGRPGARIVVELPGVVARGQSG